MIVGTDAIPRPPFSDVPHGNETILLVDDDEEVLGVCALVLRGLGYRVLESTSSDEALQIVAQYHHTIDLLVTDVVMPVHNGCQLVQYLDLLRRSVKVLFMSGYPSDILKRNGIAEGKVDVLPKPFWPSTLGRRVREALDGEGVRRNNASPEQHLLPVTGPPIGHGVPTGPRIPETRRWVTRALEIGEEAARLEFKAEALQNGWRWYAASTWWRQRVRPHLGSCPPD